MSIQAAPQPPRMSFEEFLDWGDDEIFAEWVEGAVQLMTAPGVRHQLVALFLAALFKHFVESNQLGDVFAPVLVRLPRSGRLPDISFVRQEKRERLTARYLDAAPDLAVEIVSRDSRTRDRRDKRREYEQAGVREYWIVDPQRQQAEFYLLGDDGKYAPLAVESGVLRSGVLDGLWIRVDWLWQDPLPPLLSVLREWGMVPE